MIYYILSAIAIAIVVSIYSNNVIGVKKIDCKFKDLPKSFNDFKILQVSDLHNKRFGLKQQYLLRMIKKQKPDIIVITGDIIHDSTDLEKVKKKIDKVRPFLENVVKIAPVYYVTGNHEVETGHAEYVWGEIQKYGVNVLINDSKTLTVGNESISVIGIADPFFYGTRRAYKPFTEELERICSRENGAFKLLLSHRPELIDIYSECDIRLALTGHAHGGQIRIPFTPQGLFAPDQGVLPKYTQGMHKKKDTTMIISRGLGNSGFPQRLFDRPELVVITLMLE